MLSFAICNVVDCNLLKLNGVDDNADVDDFDDDDDTSRGYL